MKAASLISASIFRPERLSALVAALLLAAMPAFAARGPAPVQRIPLEPMGYQPPSKDARLAADSMMSLHYVDESHLLVTFNTRGLMRRLPDSRAEDEDRTIAAVLLELPSGKVAARTEWRIHDDEPFLWDLGGGRFLLRLRDTLSTFSPLAAPGREAFAQRAFATSDTPIRHVIVSQDKGVVILEMMKPPPQSDTPRLSLVGVDDAPVSVSFLRVSPPGAPVSGRLAGGVRAKSLVDFTPLAATGYIQSTNEAPNRWLFDYKAYTGKSVPLSGFETTCDPFPLWVSGSEFVSFGCRGSQESADLAGFNMKGEEMWQINFGEGQGFPEIHTAPLAGRFALGRGLTLSMVGPATRSQITVQEVRVIQAYNGKQLLRVECSPVARLGQNFAISPDGMTLAVLHDGIDIYRLPALNDEDRKAVADARAHDPAPEPDAPIDLREHAVPEAAQPEPAGPPAAEGKGSVPDAPMPQPDMPRKPPTLYDPAESPQP